MSQGKLATGQSPNQRHCWMPNHTSVRSCFSSSAFSF